MAELFLLIIAVTLVLSGRILRQVRDEKRFGIVVADFDEFLGILTHSEVENVFVKRLFGYRTAHVAYTIVHQGFPYTYVADSLINESFPNGTKLVQRHPKLV